MHIAVVVAAHRAFETTATFANHLRAARFGNVLAFCLVAATLLPASAGLALTAAAFLFLLCARFGEPDPGGDGRQSACGKSPHSLAPDQGLGDAIEPVAIHRVILLEARRIGDLLGQCTPWFFAVNRPYLLRAPVSAVVTPSPMKTTPAT